jgi:hypothetical protein
MDIFVTALIAVKRGFQKVGLAKKAVGKVRSDFKAR